MNQPVVQQHSMPRRHLQRDGSCGLAVLLNIGVRQGAAEGAQQAQTVRAFDGLHTTVGGTGIVQRNPNGHQRITVQLPDRTAILMPRQSRAVVSRLIHDHGAKEGNGRMGAIHLRADLSKQRLGNQLRKQPVMLQPLYLAVPERALFKPFHRIWQGLVFPAGIELHLHGRVVNIAQCQSIRTLLQGFNGLGRQHRAQVHKTINGELLPSCLCHHDRTPYTLRRG